MNISTISAAAPKFQNAKINSNTASNINFKGLEKAAGIAGEAAANAANKTNIGGTIAKVLSVIAEGLKNFGQKILKGFKKFISGSYDINIGKNNTVSYVVNGKKVSAEEFSKVCKEVPAEEFSDISKLIESSPNVVIKQSTSGGVSHVSQKLASGEKFSVTRKNGQTYVNGKIFTPGGELPAGVTFKDGVFYIDKGNGKTVTIMQTDTEI